MKGEKRGNGVDEVQPAQSIGSGQTGQDLPGALAVSGLVAAGDLAGNDGRTQSPFGSVIGRLDGHIGQTLQEVRTLLVQTLSNGLCSRVDYGIVQQAIRPLLELGT